jgi:hypothetical protein
MAERHRDHVNPRKSGRTARSASDDDLEEISCCDDEYNEPTSKTSRYG